MTSPHPPQKTYMQENEWIIFPVKKTLISPFDELLAPTLSVIRGGLLNMWPDIRDM